MDAAAGLLMFSSVRGAARGFAALPAWLTTKRGIFVAARLRQVRSFRPQRLLGHYRRKYFA
jgi:hypothetical protein